ncbi:nucleotide-diphospho-sugar transferase [Tilletiaria anomala UBC 951]|uniref:UDP-N-acetylglucosamine diphosphorylase n=1 Tax=Tilletiaria anomala (strain ATCC 24038 / CBS 436.72 / UBC 951) TaxID=1037660 RepID=A0A066VHE8_TILAU|nr:nucleotide-diphospho-sugar transferase [Tilletiaria anomala UBC 951]KDN41162.1 nucleotide-diphospho-sugar transferase [Tilletiaria anomala UBC 951]
MAIDIVALKQRYAAAGQAHLFTFFDTLSSDEQSIFAAQLAALDVERVNSVYAKAVEADAAAAAMASSKAVLGPPPAESTISTSDASGKDAPLEQELRMIGLEAIAQGQVGVLLMAGGQGTRLGSSAPKGCYDIGLPSHKSLFQLQAERIRRLQTLAEKAFSKEEGSVVIPWYIMTSGPTRKPTEEFFKERNHFGLEAKNVIFFEQGTLPCLTLDGKILLDTKSSIATAPDGNGGLYKALRDKLYPGSSETAINSLQTRGIKYLHCYGVDNCLVRVGDPIFLGACIKQGVQVGVKVVTKTDPAESVGVVALRDGKFTVIEYSELPKELAEAKDKNHPQELAFRAANIVNHFYTTSFLALDVPAFEAQMAFHVARKKIPTLDMQTGERIKPTSPNGMKLELFVFDVFPFVGEGGLTVHEVPRQEEFSPLKNAPGTGTDDPQTSRRDLLAQQRRWIEKAGADVRDGAEIELSPLVTYTGEGLDGLKGKSFTESTVVDSI